MVQARQCGAGATARARCGGEKDEEDVKVEDDKSQDFFLHIFMPCGAISGGMDLSGTT